MNKKGQTLVSFVICIPILILLMAFVVDTGLVLKEKTKLNSTTKTILKTTYKEKEEATYQEKVIDLYKKNQIPVENLKIEIKETNITIKNEYEKPSIFGNIIGIKEYKIKNQMIAKEINGKLQIEKE